MDKLFPQTLRSMTATLRALEKRVPSPKRVAAKDGFVFRYTEQSIHQALIQKLARVVSGLNAAWILLNHGFVQEQASLQRMLDEFQEDISFLACAVIYDDVTDLHQKYLADFYQEEFDNPGDPLSSTQKRPMPSRKKIRAYLARMEGHNIDPSRSVELLRTINKAYSGFVHGASPAIMDMYGGNPPHFHTEGLLGTPRMEDHRNDLWNYFYRGIVSFCFVAKAFGDEILFKSIVAYSERFAQQAGKQYAKPSNS